IAIPMLHWAKKPWHMIEESVYKTCAHILAALKGGRDADTSGRDNLTTYAICEAAYEANATGRAVKPVAAEPSVTGWGKASSAISRGRRPGGRSSRSHHSRTEAMLRGSAAPIR